MGWYGQQASGYLTPKQEQDAQYNHEDENRSVRVLASAWVNFREYYAAIEVVTKATGERVVTCAMDLLEKRRDGMIWYKPMGEDMGPYFYGCPGGILDLLTEAQSDNARNWRAKCREVLAKKAALRRVKIGDRVTFKSPYGGTISWYVAGTGRRTTFAREPRGYLCRLKGWINHVDTVEAA